MKSIKLNTVTHDIEFLNGELQMVDDSANDPAQIKQALRHRLLFFRGEWFLDTTVGLPYFTEIMVKTPNIPNIAAIIKSEILMVSGVISISQFDLNYDIPNRKLIVNFTVSTIYGSTTITETI